MFWLLKRQFPHLKRVRADAGIVIGYVLDEGTGSLIKFAFIP
jgi:hypothetical protein